MGIHLSSRRTMPGLASATGLISARLRPIRRTKPKQVELSGDTIPARFSLRPFAGLFNPFPYGCSVLCNHPADCEAKDVVRRAKDTWATEGRALLLPEEMEMIRANLRNESNTTVVPEELFRKYTETDSRPVTPAPTLITCLNNQLIFEEDDAVRSDPKERTTLVLDLRTESKTNEGDSFTWHAITLEAPLRKTEICVSKASLVPKSRTTTPLNDKDLELNQEEEGDRDTGSDEPIIIRRRGKKLKKRKCRRGSTYGQQTSEVRDPPEPSETQVSTQIDEGTRPNILDSVPDDTGDTINELEKPSNNFEEPLPRRTSFIPIEILEHLCRELDRDKIEYEFSSKKRIALEEALKYKGTTYHSTTRGPIQLSSNPSIQNAPRLFFRQSARFELLDGQSLINLTPMEYLARHVTVTPSRKMIFGRAFNKFYEETNLNERYIPWQDLDVALIEIVGKKLSKLDQERLKDLLSNDDDNNKSLTFKQWCGICALVERFFVPLPPRESDPPTWLERVDFESLERRLKSISKENVHPRLIELLRYLRDL